MRRQLIVTLIFPIISLCVLGTASYAWYSNNTVTQASGISLSVVFPIYIVAIHAQRVGAALFNYIPLVVVASPQAESVMRRNSR